MRADAAALRRAEPSLETLASGVAGLLTRLTAALDVEGACWGDDEVGAAFEQGYLPAAISVLGALPRLRDGFAGTGAAILSVADNVDAADERARARFQ